jgi:hypothetical protein
MGELVLTTFDWVPEMPRGYVRDLRLRWAGLPYRVESVPFRDRTAGHFAHQLFGWYTIPPVETMWREPRPRRRSAMAPFLHHTLGHDLTPLTRSSARLEAGCDDGHVRLAFFWPQRRSQPLPAKVKNRPIDTDSP